MRVGDKRKLTIPPSMGFVSSVLLFFNFHSTITITAIDNLYLPCPWCSYGNKNIGQIPANSWLIFDVELVSVNWIPSVPFSKHCSFQFQGKETNFACLMRLLQISKSVMLCSTVYLWNLFLFAQSCLLKWYLCCPATIFFWEYLGTTCGQIFYMLFFWWSIKVKY